MNPLCQCWQALYQNDDARKDNLRGIYPMTNDHMPNRKERRAAAARGEMTTEKFLQLADQFIDVANRLNQNIPATDLHMAFLYGAARYNAHVCKNVVEQEDQEVFVEEMTKAYQEMLRNHLADPAV